MITGFEDGMSQRREPGPIDLMYEAIREGNPRGLNRKLMKDMRRSFKTMRRIERVFGRMDRRIRASKQ